ncbi:putative toxin-antitoxin system toxin component, PIN family [Thioalkalivibrio sp.]|uniref:PIN domain-containing protein n=1 Tax=Thioalkalivibrio sp. TaxID=2093813 RepID=UPI0012D59782|nr:PIN domain-containing protein [Thioalkalivibrio sp.]TVP80432.1 MAG: PIN domain-containing protein [Thioalkalivibrio sp.]
MRLFLDANILFSAAWKEGSDALLLFELAQAGHCKLTTSGLALEEARRNIARKRPERQFALERLVKLMSLGREPAQEHLAIARTHGLPDKDIPVLAAAIAQRADLLVTGDRRDFGHLYGSNPGEVEVIGLAGAIERVLDTPE